MNIKFSLPEATRVGINIYNTVGEEITEIVKEYETGYHKMEFNATGYASGIYFYRIVAGDFDETKKIMLLK